MSAKSRRRWRPVITAGDCEPCDCCGELACPVCADHYADCDCPGPSQDDEFDYRVDRHGTLIASPKTS